MKVFADSNNIYYKLDGKKRVVNNSFKKVQKQQAYPYIENKLLSHEEFDTQFTHTQSNELTKTILNTFAQHHFDKDTATISFENTEDLTQQLQEEIESVKENSS